MAGDFDPYHRWLGIPPEEQPPNHYRLLGIVRFENDREVISNASDQRMAHLRSLAAGKHAAEAQRLLNEVAAATRCLLDSAKKPPYDSQLRAALAPVPSQPARPLPVATAIPLQPAAAPTVVSPAPGGFLPQVGPRRPVRRGNKVSNAAIVASLLVFALVGGGAIYAWRASQPVAKKPAKPNNDGSAKKVAGKQSALPPEGPVAAKTSDSSSSAVSAADKNRRAWFYTNSPEKARGIVYLDSGKRWLEKTSDGRSNEFVEREVTDDLVKLEDASRKLVIWLKAKEMTYSRDGAKERFCMKGEWVPAADISALLASLGRPALPESRPETSPGKTEVVALRRFTGTNQANFKCPPDALEPGKPLTVEFWYRRDGDFNDSCGLIQLGDLNVVFKHNGEAEAAEHSCHVFSASSRTSWNAASGWKADKQWHHLALGCDAGELSVFHDGKPVAQLALADLKVESLEPLVLGAARSDQGNESFRGDMKSIRIVATAEHQPGRTFTPSPAQADQLLADSSLTLSSTKEMQPESEPRSLADLLPGATRPTEGSMVRRERVALPESGKLKAAKETVQSVYGPRARMAQKPEDKRKLAAELLETAIADADATRAYALLEESRRLAGDAMDATLSIDILKELDRRFDVDRLVELEKFLDGLEKRSLSFPDREVLVGEAFAGVAEALKQDKVELADSLSVLATRSASKGKDPDKKKFALALRERVVARKSAWNAMKAGQKKLADAPEDPAANLAVGRYLAFALDDYAKGCEHLAKGSDDDMAAAAKLQLAAQSDDDHLAAAEAWSGVLSDMKSPAEKLHLQNHILDVCQDLAPRLTGLPLAQAQKQIEQLTPLVAEGSKYIAASGSSTEMNPGLITRVVVNRGGKPVPSPIVGTARTESDVLRFSNTPLMRLHVSERPRYALSGAVVAGKDLQVRLRFENCAVTLRNERRIATRSRPIDQVVMLKRGAYPIYIESGEFSFGFDVADADTGVSLLFHRPSDLEAELQKLGFDLSGAQVKSQRIN